MAPKSSDNPLSTSIDGNMRLKGENAWSMSYPSVSSSVIGFGPYYFFAYFKHTDWGGLYPIKLSTAFLATGQDQWLEENLIHFSSQGDHSSFCRPECLLFPA